jgi:regulator of sirC expression with transglutaminase-like and TPR domain
MINQDEVKALFTLLEDEDELVAENVENRLFLLGEEVLPFLEVELFNPNQTQYQKIDTLIHKIRFEKLLKQFQHWKESPEPGLLEGILLVNKFGHPEADDNEIRNILRELKLKVWLELHYDLTSFEKVKIINHILFDFYKLKPNTEFYHHPENSYIGTVLTKKTGNPITLSVIYMLIAEMLEIPVQGVNIPQHFMMAYVDDEATLREDTSVLFYINAFNYGVVYSHSHIQRYIESLGLKASPEFTEPCSNVEIIRRCCRNLLYSYEVLTREAQVVDLKRILETLSD